MKYLKVLILSLTLMLFSLQSVAATSCLSAGDQKALAEQYKDAEICRVTSDQKSLEILRLEAELSEAKDVAFVKRPETIAASWILFFAAGILVGKK